VGDVSIEVGDLLPKGRVGANRLTSVFGQKFVVTVHGFFKKTNFIATQTL
jgi:hypothetical protein